MRKCLCDIYGINQSITTPVELVSKLRIAGPATMELSSANVPFVEMTAYTTPVKFEGRVAVPLSRAANSWVSPVKKAAYKVPLAVPL